MQTPVRDALVAFVNDDFKVAYPDLPLVFDNAPFDWNDLPSEFVRFEIQFLDGSQVGASFTPKTRLRGFVYVTHYAREGSGSRAGLSALDWFIRRLSFATAGPALLQEVKPNGSAEVLGYYTSQIGVPFYTIPL